MSNSPAPASRVADYFFVAGLSDHQLIPTFAYAKKHQRTSETDVLYYQQQENAVANNGVTATEEIDVFDVHLRQRGYSVNELPVLRSALSKDASLLGVLDHVQNVIDNFDKERDSARDNVIAVHDPISEFKRSESDKTITYDSISKSKSRKWRSSSLSHLKSRQDATPIPNIFDLKYTPTVLMKYPKTNDASNSPFPSYAAMFCFPRDITLYCGKTPPPTEQCHSFTLTDENGSILYGTCIIFYEKLTNKLKDPVNTAIKDWTRSNMDASTIEYAQHLKAKIELEEKQLEEAKTASLLSEEVQEMIRTSQENISLYRELLEPVKMAVSTADDVWVPKAISLLGRMPWMNLYSDWLKILLDNIVGVAGHRNAKPTIDIESTVINMIDEVPLPPPGRFEIGLTINKRPLFFSRPPINQVPILKDFSLYPLFRALSPHLILAILETLLSEGKVIFLSEYTGMLSLACESFRYLLFPFYWQFVYIPVLPERLLTCLQAPVPYMIGFKGTINDLEGYSPEDACIINLDSNTMLQSERSMPIPNRQRRKLQAALEQYAPLHTKCKIPYGVPLSAKCVYPKGKLILNCSRSKISDVFVNLPRDSESSSDTTSIWSHSTSLVPSGFWSSNASTRSSNELSTKQVSSTQSLQSSLSNTSQQQQRIMKLPSQDGSKTKLSVFISKPKTIFNHGEDSAVATSPPISVTSTRVQTSMDYIPRRMKHIEGHIMAEILPLELSRFHEYRCVCGELVEETQVSKFMCCQECNLVTHDECTDQILHPCLPACFDEKKIHGTFIRMFASLLYSYRTGFVDSIDEKNGSSIIASDGSNKKSMVFSKDKFIKHSDKDTRDFLTQLTNSQMFTQFITDRILKSSQEPEIQVFDEYIKLKLNRSKLKLVKEDTPFLNDQSYRVSQVIWSRPPPEPTIAVGDYKRFPTHLQFKQPL